MSKYLVFDDVVFKSKSFLLKALADCGYTDVEVNDEGLNLVGFQGDQRKERCQIVIRRKYVGGASNDVGFMLTPKGYVPVVSEYDRRAHGRLVPNVNTAYSQRVVSEMNRRLQGRVHRSETATELVARIGA